MKRITALLLVFLVAGASGRLLLCDYSCGDHARGHASSQPICHETEPAQDGPALSAGQNSCDAQPPAITDVLVGKITSLSKPALVSAHVETTRTLLISTAASAQPRARRSVLLASNHTTPLRI
jgi:hypothetical protein